MSYLDGRAIFAALVTVLAIITILLAILVYRRNQVLIENQSVLSAIPCSEPPLAPTNLVVTNPQADLLILQFSATLGSEDYLSQLSAVPNFTDSEVLQEKISENNSSAFGNLTLGATYYFRVKARNSCGDSPWSVYASFQPIFNYPSPSFVIATRNNPGIEICDNYDDTFAPLRTDQVRASAFCSEQESFYFYEESDQSYRQRSRNIPQAGGPRCMTRGPGNDVFNSICNGSAAQKWNYNGLDFSICDPNDPQNGCLIKSGTSTTLNPVTFGPKSTGPGYEWVIKET